jgi:Domain of unknown function (DUF1905)
VAAALSGAASVGVPWYWQRSGQAWWGVEGCGFVEPQRFTVTVADRGRGRLLIVVPFDPDQTWGKKAQHHITGTVNGIGVRGVIEPHGDGFGFTLGPAWRRGCEVAVGDTITVVIQPEDPQRSDLAADVAAALAANPQALATRTGMRELVARAYAHRGNLGDRTAAEAARILAAEVDNPALGHLD